MPQLLLSRSVGSGGMGLSRCERSGGPASHTASALGGGPASDEPPAARKPGFRLSWRPPRRVAQW
jgi:hypothetical protein